MKQTLLKIRVPDGHTLYPRQLRGLVAKLDKPSPALFARDEFGTSVKYPGVRFVGGRNWVGVLADEAHEEVLSRSIGDVLLQVSRHVGQPCPVEVEQHDLSLNASDRPYNYRASRIALKLRTHKGRNEPTSVVLADRIYGSIDRTCAQFGLDCPDQESMGIMNVVIERDIGMRLDTAEGETGEFVSLIEATFTLHADLRGMWFVGNLTARGHGRVFKQYALKGV